MLLSRVPVAVDKNGAVAMRHLDVFLTSLVGRVTESPERADLCRL